MILDLFCEGMTKGNCSFIVFSVNTWFCFVQTAQKVFLQVNIAFFIYML